MNILYLGDDFVHSTSSHRAQALRRLGHEVFHLNPRAPLPSGPLVGGVSVRFGFWPFSGWVAGWLRRQIGTRAFDVAWIDAGSEISPAFHRWLKQRGVKIVNYNVDDPFGLRDGRKWALYRQSVSYHDLTVVVREENVGEARAAGARDVMRVYRSYDPVAHARIKYLEKETQKWANDVAFVGSWMPERGPFMTRLLDLGVPLSIWGSDWVQAPEFERLKSVFRGPAVYGADYVKPIQCGKIALGLLSKGNRDLHTQRSAEVPYIGGAIFCAERTSEHTAMFRENAEAVFWSTPEECVVACQSVLADPERRNRMAVAAQVRVQHLKLSNDAVMARVLAKLCGETIARDRLLELVHET